MRPAGTKETLIARWREAGEWWTGEPYREFERVIDSAGVRRERMREAPSLGSIASGQSDYREDNTIEVSERARGGRGEMSFGVKMPERLHRRDDWGMPIRTASPIARRVVRAGGYAPLHVCSGYAFGCGTMPAEEIPLLAATYGIEACAITDPMSLVGAVEFSRACRRQGIRPLIGASFPMPEGGTIVLIARSKRGYVSLSRLISECHLGEPRLYPLANWERLERFSEDLFFSTGGDSGPLNPLLIKRDFSAAARWLDRAIAIYGPGNVMVEIERSYLPWQIATNPLLLDLAKAKGVSSVAGGLITHARREDFPAQDILTCVETLCTVEEIIGRKARRHPDQPRLGPSPDRALNAERFFRSSSEMRSLFSDSPELVANTVNVAERCDDEVLPDRTCLPQLYEDENRALEEITFMGAFERHGRIAPKLRRRLHHELDRIKALGFSRHFLTARDMVRWAHEEQIQYSGRGSVVDSAVAYCLGLSRIDAFRHNLHFDRFLPIDGSKRPDIDIDFEARRRDDVRQYLTDKYGRENVGTVAAVGTYRTRGIVREVGKALGLPNETIGFLAKRIHGGVPAHQLESALQARPELRDSAIPKERFTWIFQLAERLMDLPRNIRAHSSGVVISSRPLCETVPVMWSNSLEPADSADSPHLRIIQFDKRSAKHFFDKFDVLCLRGQDVLSGAESRIRINNSDFSVNRIPTDDPETYRAMRSGELIGIPQSASPAMRQAHVRLRTENLRDASLVQAGIRPGVGGAVKLNQLIARRLGKESYSFEHPELERILGHTYGVIVFQEQVDQLLQAFCGFSSGQAEDLRDSIYKRRREDFAQDIREELRDRIIERGFSLPIAEKVVEYVVGFKGYGFAEGHALAFAEISVRSISCQQNYPAEYFAALLSAQPAGYYGPCTIANEARSRGVLVLPVDVDASEAEFAVEEAREGSLRVPGGAIRIALKQVSGLSEETRGRILSTPRSESPMIAEEVSLPSVRYRRAHGVAIQIAEQAIGFARKPLSEGGTRFSSFFDFVAKVRPDRDELERLILCGALDFHHPNRRALLWAIPRALDFAQAIDPHALPILMPEPEIPPGIDDFTPEEKAIAERRILGMDSRRHLMAFEREKVSSRGGVTVETARRLDPGRKAIVVGNPIRLRFPPTASGKRVVFFDLEDETGLLNVTVFDDVYQRDGKAVVCSPYVTIIGESQDRDGHTAFLAHRVFDYRPVILHRLRGDSLSVSGGDFLVG